MSDDQMKYKVLSLPVDADIFAEYPELRKIPGLRAKAASTQKVLRYGFLLFDPKSKLLTEVSHLKDRKDKALHLAGYKKTEGVWEPEADEILKDQNDEVRWIMWVIISQVFHDRKCREYHLKQQELSEYTKLRWEPVKGDDKLADAKLKGSLREQCDDLNEALDALEAEIFGSNEETKKFVEKIMLTSPERVAAAYIKTQDTEPTNDEL